MVSASDNENIEMTSGSSSFQESSDLDQYGVWVKKGSGTNVPEALSKDSDNSKISSAEHEAFIFEDTDSDMNEDYDYIDNPDEIEKFPDFKDLEDDDFAGKLKDLDYDDLDNSLNDFETLDMDSFLNEDTLSDTENFSDDPFSDNQENDIFSSEYSSGNSEFSNNYSSESDESFNFGDSSFFDSLDSVDSKKDSTDEFSNMDFAGAEDIFEGFADIGSDMSINVNADEDTDISTMTGSLSDEDSFDDIDIFGDYSSSGDAFSENVKSDDVECKTEKTIIEGDNVDFINTDDQKVLNHEPETDNEENSFDALDSLIDEAEDLDSSISGNNVSGDTDTVFDEDEFDDLEENSGIETEDEVFNDIEAVTNDLIEPVNQTAQSVHTQTGSFDKATEILMQIASELSMIRAEISELKSEILMKKAVPEQPFADSADIKGALPPSQESTDSGFFTDDDGDETISLTGDELNNILITADFIEENGGDGAVQVIDASVSDGRKKGTSKPIEAEYINTLDDAGSLNYLEGDDSVLPSEQEINIAKEPSLEIPPFTEQNSSSVEAHENSSMPSALKDDIKSVLSYFDSLLESLPDEKLEEFAHSKHFETFKRLLGEL